MIDPAIIPPRTGDGEATLHPFSKGESQHEPAWPIRADCRGSRDNRTLHFLTALTAMCSIAWQTQRPDRWNPNKSGRPVDAD